MDNVINLKKYIRGKDIAKLYGIARSTVDNWARYGYLTRHKVGRNIFYDYNEVVKLAEMS
jgi:predicted site-specific integrase-resolvase